ncbi:hypothetical protein Fmac_014794 [Flemingia macrophylla]|uniref:Encoded peptide n=1 Tax=Flemingia macrophylla TaxID=520843 RepID=A0ABD1MCQ5_9FABA
MARLTHTCLLFVLLFLSHELLSTEGRNLKQSIMHSPDTASPTNAISIATKTSHGDGDHIGVQQEGSRRVGYEVDDFRPTTPGHSPGVGHSINN